MQEVEGGLKPRSGLSVIAATGRLGRGQQLLFQGRIIERGHIADPDRDRLDQVVRESQGEEIGGKVGIDRRRWRGRAWPRQRQSSPAADFALE